MKFPIVALFFSALFFVAACSNQYRSAEPQVDGRDVDLFVKDALSFAISESNVGEFEKLYADPDTRLYYTEGPSEFGNTPHTVAPIYDWSFLGAKFSNYKSEKGDFQMIQVFLLEKEDQSGGQWALMIRALTRDSNGPGTGQSAVRAFYNTSSTGIERPSGTDGEILIPMRGPEGQMIALRSYDVVDGFLANVIQLEVNKVVGGTEEFIGKITTLFAFD